MTHWGSFSPDAYQSYLNGVQNPSGFSVVSPALASRAASDVEDEGYEDEDGGEMYEDEEEEFESNAAMAMGQLRSMAEDIMVILSNMTPDDNLEPWVAAKITMSKQNLSAVADYLEYND